LGQKHVSTQKYTFVLTKRFCRIVTTKPFCRSLNYRGKLTVSIFTQSFD